MIINAQSSGVVAFAANGTVSGSIQVADSTLFWTGAIVYLNDNTGLNMECTVAGIPDATHILVRQTETGAYGTSDIQAFTVANVATVTMPPQILQGNDEILLRHVSFWTGLA